MNTFRFTLYDFLIQNKYNIVEALKSGFPKYSYYNSWVETDILNNLIELNDCCNDDLLDEGVYSLDDYYIGKTNKPIILRIIQHLLDTIPTVKETEKRTNYDKVMCTKLNLLMNNKLNVSILSKNPDDEEQIIKDNYGYNDYVLTNKQFNKDNKSYLDYFEYKFESNAIFNTSEENSKIFINKSKLLLERDYAPEYEIFNKAYIRGKNIRTKGKNNG